MIAELAELCPQAGRYRLIEAAATYGGSGLAARSDDEHTARKVSHLTGDLRRSSRPTERCATERSRSVTIGNNHAVFVSATTYTEYGCGPSAV
ncbi:hypothetical protein AB0E27_41345 [Streptomyces sparsogenes]|uniref:hypothetical protein n=1 Tax=Streptomyces sparsogenes TaxID=67365 RepID=UPI0033E0F7A8